VDGMQETGWEGCKRGAGRGARERMGGVQERGWEGCKRGNGRDKRERMGGVQESGWEGCNTRWVEGVRIGGWPGTQDRVR
jgi:hypothetical protein